MDKLLRELTDQIYKFNNFLEKKALFEKDIIEEESNLKDTLETEKKLNDLLSRLKKISPGDLDKDNADLMELHILLDNLSWYFQNIHERLISVFKNYPQKND